MKAAPAAALEVVEPELILELLKVALNPPSERRQANEFDQGGGGGQRREPVLRRGGVPHGPFDQEPFHGPGGHAPLIAMGRSDSSVVNRVDGRLLGRYWYNPIYGGEPGEALHRR